MIVRLISLLICWSCVASAQSLDFPSNATLQQEVKSELNSYPLPVGIWENGVMPTEVVEGEMTQQAWRIAAQSLTTLQLLRPLREQLRNDRYRVIFTEYVSLFVSRTAQAGFIQVTRVGPPTQEETPLVTTAAPAIRGGEQSEITGLVAQLDRVGHAVLDDLAFQTGSSQLGEGPFISLQTLADYLTASPDLRVALVGHTDTSGALDANIALSRRRAASVVERLVNTYGISRNQLAAEGMGYLSPLDTNTTEDGRNVNRRVEVIVTSIPQE